LTFWVNNFFEMLNPFIKLARSVQERGWRGTVLQLYTIGDLKFGKLMGTDKFGNQYYEDRTLPYGQHRWVEYTNIHNPDTTMIQPEWHGWMHHVFDETPDKVRTNFDDKLIAIEETNAIFEDHIGDAHPTATDQVNLTQYRWDIVISLNARQRFYEPN
jgi:NADH:ubiquinone oxidoreductase subunit